MAIVEIDGKEVTMLANAATPVIYQRIFGEDLLLSYNKLAKKNEKEAKENPKQAPDEMTETDAESVALAKRLGFTMAMQAESVGHEEKMVLLSLADFWKWLGQFEDPLSLEGAAMDIFSVYYGEEEPTAEAKKEDAPQTDH